MDAESEVIPKQSEKLLANNELPVELHWESFFAYQRATMREFDHIEESHGLLQTPAVPVDINSFQGQARLRDFAWRTTEEIGEYYLARLQNNQSFHEELADALHFLIEFFILAGISPEHLPLFENLKPMSGNNQEFQLIMELTWAGNLLRNRPWKQKSRPTDVGAFRIHAINAMMVLVSLFLTTGATHQDIYDLYLRKNKVNRDRIASGV